MAESEESSEAFTLEEIDAADIILGAQDDVCTYADGYKARQALFSCVTCRESSEKEDEKIEGSRCSFTSSADKWKFVAGVCTGCSLTCHKDHELVELWTKRKFRCDCGNSKFGSFSCQLEPNKDPINEGNHYGQNFLGLYCTCCRPFPDPDRNGTDDLENALDREETETRQEIKADDDDQEEESMHQCVVCEDWFHSRHLGLPPDCSIPFDEEGEPNYEDFVCADCVHSKCQFLSHYESLKILYSKANCVPSLSLKEDLVVSGVTQNSTTGNGATTVASRNNESGWEGERNPKKPKLEESAHIFGGKEFRVESSSIGCQENSFPNENKGDKNGSEAKGDAFKCKLTSSQALRRVDDGGEAEKRLPLFLSPGWRAELCRCESCIKMYGEFSVSFLLDESDSLAHYEALTKQLRKKKDEDEIAKQLKGIHNMDRVKAIGFVEGINKFATSLDAFLTSIKESGGTVVTKEDIETFKEMLNKQKPSYN